MSNTKEQPEASGPFEVTGCSAHLSACGMTSTQHNAQTAIDEDINTELEDQAPTRDLDCCNYERCLGLAAALNWDSFSCCGCSGKVNENLAWRAGQVTRKDSVAKALCGTPKFATFNGCPDKIAKRSCA